MRISKKAAEKDNETPPANNVLFCRLHTFPCLFGLVWVVAAAPFRYKDRF